MVTTAAAGVGLATAGSAAGFWLATRRFGLFERSVAAGSIGREKVVETMEDAVEHNDADERRVEVRATEGVDPTTVTLTVVDNGPGIPGDERAVLQSGDVTPLEHGSGLGLWIAKWGIARLGGELSFAATELRGTIVTIRLPVDGPDADALEVAPAALTRVGS